ncbi:MAG: hypothetical protein WAN44_02685 [Propionibacteriaceae bacterium]
MSGDWVLQEDPIHGRVRPWMGDAGSSTYRDSIRANPVVPTVTCSRSRAATAVPSMTCALIGVLSINWSLLI